jgi:hypothetical protein
VIPSFSSNLIGFFLNKVVIVDAEGYRVKGRLIHYQMSDRQGHVPNILILQENVKIIVRAWNIIGSVS